MKTGGSGLDHLDRMFIGDVACSYKYDIPVLHLNGLYWTKHKLDMAAGWRCLEEQLKLFDDVTAGEALEAARK